MKDIDKKINEKVDENTKYIKVMDERLITMERTLKTWL